MQYHFTQFNTGTKGFQLCRLKKMTAVFVIFTKTRFAVIDMGGAIQYNETNKGGDLNADGNGAAFLSAVP
jgi:hypothetical protein